MIFLKGSYLVMVTLFVISDDFEEKRNIVERYEKKKSTNLSRHLFLIAILLITFFVISPNSLVSLIIFAVFTITILVQRDFFITLAFKFPKHKTSILKFINAHWYEEDGDKDFGYDSLKTREKLMNSKVIGHDREKLKFYHKFQKDTGIDILWNSNPRRGNGVIGTAGSGKTYSILDPMAIQTIIDLGIPMAEYDFKFPSQANVAFYAYLQKKKKDPDFNMKFATTTFSKEYIHNTFRTNPICRETITTDLDGDMYMKTFLQCFNRKWQEDDSDFWFKSTYAYGAGVIKAFSKYMPNFTFAHILDFFRYDYEEQIKCLVNLDDPEVNAKIEAVRKPIVEGKAADQVSGIFSTLQNDIGPMHNRYMFFAISKSEASLHMNNPENPTQLIIGNNNKYKKIFGPVISLYYAIIFNLCNNKHQLPLHVLIDEAATLNLMGVDEFINTGRSNGMITTLGFQGFSQSDFIYGDKLARVILTSLGNWYFGQINDERAIETVVKTMGKYKTEIKNKSINKGRGGTGLSTNLQEENFIRYEEVGEFDQGYFTGKMSEGEYKRFLGQTDVSEFKPYMDNAENQILPLGPSVHHLMLQGDISKDDIRRYYNGHKGSAARINEAVDKYADKEYKRIQNETSLFLMGQPIM